MDKEVIGTIITVFVSVVGGGALLAFIQFLITRKDNKTEKKNEVLEAIKGLEAKIDTQKQDTDDRFTALEARMEEERTTNARIRILGFSDEIMHGFRHSEESFNQSLQDITMYNQYCKHHPEYENARAKVAIANIQTVYERCVREGDFLGMKGVHNE